MAKQPTKKPSSRKPRKSRTSLRDPANREIILNFVRELGAYTVMGKNCWDDICAPSTFFDYLQRHPEFVKELDQAKDDFSTLRSIDSVQRVRSQLREIDDLINHGYVERHAEVIYKTDEHGNLLLDERNKPIPLKYVGPVKETTRPCPATILLWRLDHLAK